MLTEANKRYIGVVTEERRSTTSRPFMGAFDTATAGWWSADFGRVSLRCEPSGNYATTGQSALCMASPYAVFVEGEALDAAALLSRVGRGGARAADAAGAPFSAVWTTPDGQLEMTTDVFGIGQQFVFREDGVLAVSNSSVLLARIFKCRLNLDALMGFALFGAFQGSNTPFDGIEKTVVPHERASLRDGSPAQPTETEVSVSAIAERLKAVVDGFSRAMPAADFQLSGGLDSRMILAALSPERRKQHRMVTLGPPDSRDVEIARAITSRLGLRHHVVDPGTIADLDANAFAALLAKTLRGFDCSANVLDKLSLVHADSGTFSASWVNGQNGEIFRGFSLSRSKASGGRHPAESSIPC